MGTRSMSALVWTLVALGGLVGCVLVWKDVLGGAPAQGKGYAEAFCGPIAVLYGTAFAVFGHDRFMAYNEQRGRKEATWLGWGLFWLGLIAGAAHFGLLVHFAKQR